MKTLIHLSAFLIILSPLAGCDQGSGPDGAGGAITEGPECPAMVASTGGGAPTGDACAAGGLPKSTCTPSAAECNASTSRCLALVDQSQDQVFGLRMSQLTVTKPAALQVGSFLGDTIASLTQPSRPACNLAGTGSLSWLLQFDLGAGTLKTGGAFPPQDPAAGYAFQDTMIPTFGVPQHIAPVTLSLGSTPPCAFSTNAGDLIVPMYTAADGSTVVLVPLHRVRFDGELSSDHGCIGAFDPVGMEEACCLPDRDHPAYRERATVTGFFVLEEADTFDSGVEQSLCALLSGDASDGPTPWHCKRDTQGHIVFHGDWCSATDQPATPGCADAVRFSATFAASGVAITP